MLFKKKIHKWLSMLDFSRIEFEELVKMQRKFDDEVSSLGDEIDYLTDAIKDRTLILEEKAKMFGRICDLKDDYFIKQIILYNLNSEFCKRTQPNIDFISSNLL